MARTILLDVYGTLLDISAPVARYAARLDGKANHVNDLWRAKQLEFAWVTTMTGAYEPFWSLTERALDSALTATGTEDDALRRDLLAAYREPDLFADVADTLGRLRDDGHRLIAFSNSDPAMLQAALEGGGVAQMLDQAVSIEPIGCFKPDPRAYAWAQKSLDLRSPPVFVSSNAWDVAGASRFGWQAFWINRKGTRYEYPTIATPPALASLAELPQLLGKGEG